MPTKKEQTEARKLARAERIEAKKAALAELDSITRKPPPAFSAWGYERTHQWKRAAVKCQTIVRRARGSLELVQKRIAQIRDIERLDVPALMDAERK